MVQQVVQERRSYIRAKRILSIQYRLAKGRRKSAEKSWGLSTTQDLSLEGLSFYTDREYCKDDILNVHVVMSGVLDVFRGYGRVVRVERKKTGVCFLAAVKFVDKEQFQKNTRSNGQSMIRPHSQKRV
jgi:hypothetical protein